VEENMMSRRGGPLLWLVLLLALACGKVDSKAEAGDTVNDRASGGCSDYCDSVMSACTGENAVYVSQEECLSVCDLLEPGDAEQPSGNTLACRAAQARSAERNPHAYCSAAGPGGNGSCGSDCEAYCGMYSQACPAEAAAQGIDGCIENCGTLVDQPSFDLVTDHGGDTIECRLVHLAVATLNPSEHCQHAQLAATQPWCVAEP
jgi:hypothetical protein